MTRSRTIKLSQTTAAPSHCPTWKQLPEPHSVTDNTAGWPGDGWAVSRNVGKVLADRPKALDPDEARKFAAALLAAANAAEENK